MRSQYRKLTDWRVDREMRRAYERECREFPVELQLLPDDRLLALRDSLTAATPIRAWRSRTHLAVLYIDRYRLRLTVQRTKLRADGYSEEGITWDDLMRLKREAGFGEQWAVECYPPDAEVVDVASMRHLWLLSDEPVVGWKKRSP